MKAIKLFWYTLVAGMLVVGCRGEDVLEPETGAVFSPHFVWRYCDANDFNLDDLGVLNNGRHGVAIGYDGKRIDFYDKDFKRWNTYYNDTCYNHKMVPSHTVLTEKLRAIKVVCDQDFDAAHPAGTSLEDIVMFCTSSPYEFIQSGYKDGNYQFPDYYQILHYDFGYKPVEMLLSEFNPDLTVMSDLGSFLYFTKQPQQAGDYTFTVTVGLKEDIEVSKRITLHMQ